MSHFPYTTMLSPCTWPRLRLFPEAAIEAGFFWTFESHAGPQGDAGTTFNSLHFSYFDSTLNAIPIFKRYLYLPMTGNNLHILPSKGKGLGPGSSL
jgi:hypothetical protein